MKKVYTEIYNEKTINIFREFNENCYPYYMAKIDNEAFKINKRVSTYRSIKIALNAVKRSNIF